MLTCCGCFSLRTGTFIIGSLDLIYMISLIAWMLGAEKYWRDILDEMYGPTVGPPMFTILIVWYAICALCILFLIAGTRYNKRKLLIPWLIKDIMAILIAVTMFIYCCIYYNMAMLFIEPITIAYSTYFWFVVYSLYRELNTSQLSPYSHIAPK